MLASIEECRVQAEALLADAEKEARDMMSAVDRILSGVFQVAAITNYTPLLLDESQAVTRAVNLIFEPVAELPGLILEYVDAIRNKL